MAGCTVRRGIALLVVTVSLAGAATAAGIPVRFRADTVAAGHGTTVLIDVDPSTLTPQPETPASIAFALPRGTRLDTRAVARRCTPAQASAFACPAASKIGWGRVVTNLSGYLFPGGETDAVAWIDAYLGTPAQAGDPASLVLILEWLGAEEIRKAIQRDFGLLLPPAKAVATGRIIRATSGAYGLEFRFDGLPGGLTLPAPLAAKVTKFKLAIGNVRRVRKDIVRRVRVRTLDGHATERIRDHVLVGYHLLRRPKPCVKGVGYDYAIVLGYPSGTRTVPGHLDCPKIRPIGTRPTSAGAAR